jgi:type VI secretion system protein ImpD
VERDPLALAGDGRSDPPGDAALAAFLAERSWARSLRLWFGEAGPFGSGWSRESILTGLDGAIAAIDSLLSEQVNAILSHVRLRRLEASWRSLASLVGVADSAEQVKIRVIHLTWAELCRDLERAIEFDQSQLFQKVYNEEFGMPGGEPFGLLIGDYEVSHQRSEEHPTDDVTALKALSQVAAAAFAPVILGASPALLGLDGFRDLSPTLDVSTAFRSPDHARWRGFQETDDCRFIGLALPRVLVRLPHDEGSHHAPFRFDTNGRGADDDGYLWGCASYAFATVVVRAFAASGWFTDIRGARRDRPLGGLVIDLPAPSFATDRPGVALKPSSDICLTERQEKELSDLGFLPLLKAKDTAYSVYYSNQSVQRPQSYESVAATVNARVSAMLQYIICVSRFAHYLKILARDRVGSFATPEECEVFLQRWLLEYCNGNTNASPETLARYPLRQGRVEVRERPGRPGDFACTMHLVPYSQVDQVVSEFKLVTEIKTRQAA